MHGRVADGLSSRQTLMKIRMVFPGLLTAQSAVYFETVWTELSNIQQAYQEFYIVNERQGRLEDVDGLPYTLDFLVVEDLDLMQALIKAPPVKAELLSQLQNAGQAVSSTWLPQVLRLAGAYAQITTEEEGLWDIDVNLFLSEETSVTANYTPRTCSGDLAVKLSEWLKSTAAEGMLVYMSSIFGDTSASYVKPCNLGPFLYPAADCTN